MADTERLKVAMLYPAGTRGGAELWQERLVVHTERLDIQVLSMADGDTANWWRANGAEVTVIPTGRSTAGLLRTARTVAIQMRQDRPDLIIGHGVKAGLVTAAAGLMGSTRTMWVRHDDSFPRLAKVTDALTDAQLNSSPKAMQGRTPRRPLVIAPMVSGPAATAADARTELGFDEGPLRMLMATRLVPYKGVDDAITALADDRAARWSLHVFCVTDSAYPDEADRLLRHASALGVTDRFHLHLSRDDIGELAGAFDAAAILTKPLPGEHVGAEAFSLVAMEANTAGVAVISVPPVSDRMGAAGIAVAPAAPGQVVEALVRLEDPAVRAAMGKAGQAAAATADSPADAASTFAQFLADCSNRPGAGVQGQAPISVVVTVLNDERGVSDLIPVVSGQLGSQDELIIVDGGSSDSTAELVAEAARADARIRLIVSQGAGISQGRNVGIEAAAHPLVACTDAGCEPQAGWLDAFRAAAAARPDAGLLTGTYQVSATTAVEHAVNACGYPQVEELARPSALARGYGAVLGRSFDATMPTGRSMAFTKDAWRAAGGFPEHLATGEDVTFGRAIARQFPAVLVRDACVVWDQRATLRGTLTMYYRYGQGSGHSRDPRLLGRDAARAGAYLIAASTALRGSRAARSATLVGAAVYLSLPLARARRMPAAPKVIALVPVVSALRDVAKAAGAITGYINGKQ